MKLFDGANTLSMTPAVFFKVVDTIYSVLAQGFQFYVFWLIWVQGYNS
jgi:hypothetical protein